jgi:hypothetical protein
MATLLHPSVMLNPAWVPTPTLQQPVVLFVRAETPKADRKEPVSLQFKVPEPTPVLQHPVVLHKAKAPIATLEKPVQLQNKAHFPTPVFW